MKTCQLLDPERDKGELFGFGDVRAYRKRCEREQGGNEPQPASVYTVWRHEGVPDDIVLKIRRQPAVLNVATSI